MTEIDWLARRIHWRRSGNVSAPWKACYDGHALKLRLGDFPAEPLYTLLVDEIEAFSLDSPWPAEWLRTVELREEEYGQDHRSLWAYVESNGNLAIDGQDLGPSVEQVWGRGVRSLLGLFVAVGCLLAVACSGGEEVRNAEPPTPTYNGPGTLQSITEGTQIHLEGVAVGAGNIWEDDYVTADGRSKRGLRAALFITVKDDASQNRSQRVYAGLDVDAPGYRFHVVSVRETSVQIAVIKVP